MAETMNFRDLVGLSRVLKGFLVVYLGIVGIALWSGWLELQLLDRVANGVAVSQAAAEQNDSRQGTVGVLQVVVFLVTAVLFLRWTYLSNSNAHALGAFGMHYSPGWAVGWYFIPIANLWKPYQALKETFKASHPDFGQDWRLAPHPEILPLWWLLWIIGTFVGVAALRVARQADTLDELRVSSVLMFVSYAVDLPLAVLVIVLVSKLQAWQVAKHQRVDLPLGEEGGVEQLADTIPRPAAVPNLIESLENGDEEVRSWAAEALGAIGPGAREAIPALIEALQCEDEDLRRACIGALSAIGPEAVPALVEALEDEDGSEEVRWAVAVALADIGPQASAAVPALIERLESSWEAEEVRSSAARALGAIGAGASAAVPALIETLKDEDLRLIAAEALGAIGPEARQAIPALIETLQDPVETVRSDAAKALTAIDPEWKERAPQ